MSCFTRLFRRSRHQGEERQASLTSTSHGSATAQQPGTQPQPAGRYFHFTHLGLPFLSSRPADSKAAPSLIDDLRAAGLTFDCMTLNDSDMAEPASEEPPRKKQKRVTCAYCGDAVSGDDYTRPCRQCGIAICHQCLSQAFTVALTDHERMPARCCDRVFYPGVAVGILKPADLQRYKERYDETTTPNPFYCPVPTCSAFIPPRLQEPVDGKLTCPVCATQACCACRKVASDDHVCELKEEKAILDTYKYKSCPKCGAGIMRMFGCAHVRCQCGAHWCWDCQRPIQACYRKPCNQSRADGDVTEESDALEELSDEEQEQTRPTGEQTRPTDEQTQPTEEQTQPTEQQAAPQEVDNGAAAEVADQSLEVPITANTEVVEATDSRPPATLPTDNSVTPNQTTTEAVDSAPAGAVSADGTSPAEGTETTPDATQPASDANAAEPEVINLDDPNDPDNDWENGDIDFGDEPVDENFDVWGCQHKFNVFNISDVPTHWLKDWNKEKGVALECMCCFKTVNVPGKTEAKQEGKRKKLVKRRGRSPAPTITLRREDASIENLQTDDATKVDKSESPTQDAQKAQAKRERKLAAYDCRECGVIYCWGCRTESLKRMRKERKTDA